MAYRPALEVDVQWEGATFRFGAADDAWSKLAAAGARRTVSEACDADAPPELIEPLCDLFVEGVVDWEGVEGADGNALACTRDSRRRIPSPDKIQIASVYLAKMQELEEKKGASGEQRTGSTGPGEPQGAPRSHSRELSADTPASPEVA